MDQQKLDFLRNDFIFLLKHLAPDAKGKWGKMNGQQMVEHFAGAVKNANGKLKLPQVNEGERLEKFREFLMSEAPFRENTKNPLLDENPYPVRHITMQAAIAELQAELDALVNLFTETPDLTTRNPIFGDLNYTQVVQLLHKHALHHLRQFGLINTA